MVIYGGGRRFREALEGKGFKIINGFELFGNPKTILIYILESSSAVYYSRNDKIFVDVFPCDLKDPNSLPKRVFSVLEDILNDENHEGEMFGVPFFITKPYRNNEFLGVNGKKKLVGFAGVYSNFKVFYYAGTIKTREDLLTSRNYREILKRIKSYLGKDTIEVRSYFGDDLGYSAVFFKENEGDFIGITLHTWPESGIVHVEIFSNKEFNAKEILENIFKEGSEILSSYEKR